MYFRAVLRSGEVVTLAESADESLRGAPETFYGASEAATRIVREGKGADIARFLYSDDSVQEGAVLEIGAAEHLFLDPRDGRPFYDFFSSPGHVHDNIDLRDLEFLSE